jgi:hypothetical protein
MSAGAPRMVGELQLQLAQLAGLSFVLGTFERDNVSTDALAEDDSHWTSRVLKWSLLQEAAVGDTRINTRTVLWLHDASANLPPPRSKRTLLLDALLGRAPVPGLSAAAPACLEDRLPEVRTATFAALSARPRVRGATVDARKTLALVSCQCCVIAGRLVAGAADRAPPAECGVALRIRRRRAHPARQ